MSNSKDTDPYLEYIEKLEEDNHRMRQAGCDLAMAAMKVIRDYDGVHRLSDAVGEWAKVIATEGTRKEDDK